MYLGTFHHWLSQIHNSALFPSLRSLFSTNLAAGTTTHVEELWSREAGWWPLLTVWTGNRTVNSSTDSVFLDRASLRPIFWLLDLNIQSLLLSQHWAMIYFSVSKCQQHEETSHSLIYNCHRARGFIYFIRNKTKSPNKGIKNKQNQVCCDLYFLHQFTGIRIH